MYLNIWSIVVIRNWHWCQLRVYTRTQTVREFIYVDLNRNHQSTHKFVYNFFWMGVTNWNFYHLAEERVYRDSFLSRLSRKSAAKRARGREEGTAVRSIQVQHVHLACSPPSTACTPTPFSTIPGVSMQRVWQNSWELFTCSNYTSKPAPAPLPRTRIQLFLQWPSLTVNMLPPPLPFPVSPSFSYPGTPVGCGWHFNLPPEPLVKLAGNERR